MDGFSSDSLRGKMEELEQEKKTLKATMKDLNVVNNEFVLTEEMLKDIIIKFKEFVIIKNIPECKKFIKHYVEKVVVYNEKVEVVIKITSTSFCIDCEKKAVPIYTTVIPIKKLWKLFFVQKN